MELELCLYVRAQVCPFVFKLYAFHHSKPTQFFQQNSNNMAISKKTSSTSSTSSSAKTRPNGTAAAANISKSAKENTTTTQATMRSSATKKTTPGNGPAAKPLQARTQSSQGVKDMDIAALLEKVAAQEGLSNNSC